MRFQEIKYNPEDLPIKFSACGAPTLDEKFALYIVDFNELFEEEINEDELKAILHSLNKLLKHKNLDLAFLQSRAPERKENAKICIQKIKKYLGEENNVSSLLEEQENDHYGISEFRAHCKEEKLTTVVMGGIFGGGCVWTEAGKLAENVYSMLLPNEAHPNIRFLIKEYGFLFEKAIILAEICEGHTFKDEKRKFHQYLCFPTSNYYKVDVGEDCINNRVYRTNVEEIQRQDKIACGCYVSLALNEDKHKQTFQKLHTKINHLIAPSKTALKRKRGLETPSLLFQPLSNLPDTSPKEKKEIQQSPTKKHETESSMSQSTIPTLRS